MPAVRRLFFVTNTGTATYLGITTGRMTPFLVKTKVVALGSDVLKAFCQENFH